MSCILKKEYKIVSVMFIICFLLMMFSKQSYATEHIASVSIPITQTLTVHGTNTKPLSINLSIQSIK